MRILADENIPGAVVFALREHGHDVQWVMEEAPGISDREVLQLAEARHRMLLTFDLDFGELIFRLQLRMPCGIILLRIPLLLPAELSAFVVQILESRDDWTNHFSVVEENSIRMIRMSG